MTTIEKEYFANKLGFKILERTENFVKISASPTKDDTNALDLVHGGYIFSIADYASALLANQGGQTAVSCNANIIYMMPALPENEIFAQASLSYKNSKTCIAKVEIISDNKVVAIMNTQLIVRK